MTIKDIIPSWKKQEDAVQKDNFEHPFYAMQRDMNRLFDNFFDEFRMTPFTDRLSTQFPQIDVKENEKSITVEAEVPGMDEKDIQISLTKNMLELHGKKTQEKEEKNQHYYHVERSFGSFQRRIPLHCEVDENNVEAVFKKGILKITLPKTPEAQQKTKRIPIHVS